VVYISRGRPTIPVAVTATSYTACIPNHYKSLERGLSVSSRGYALNTNSRTDTKCYYVWIPAQIEYLQATLVAMDTLTGQCVQQLIQGKLTKPYPMAEDEFCLINKMKTASIRECVYLIPYRHIVSLRLLSSSFLNPLSTGL
jgi:hypothetical protein